MYLPTCHQENDPATLHALIRAHPLGAWVAPGAARLVANHLPFVLDAERGPHGTLRAHVSRANPVWRELAGTVPSVVMFQGPQGYITPSWYPSKQDTGQVVPTWNYAVVHAHGLPRVVHDSAWLHALVCDLTQQQEAGRSPAWAVGDAPRDYIDRMLRAIVGIEIPIDTLEGKWKLSQDELPQDRAGTAAGLARGGDAHSLALARLVDERLGS